MHRNWFPDNNGRSLPFESGDDVRHALQLSSIDSLFFIFFSARSGPTITTIQYACITRVRVFFFCNYHAVLLFFVDRSTMIGPPPFEESFRSRRSDICFCRARLLFQSFMDYLFCISLDTVLDSERGDYITVMRMCFCSNFISVSLSLYNQHDFRPSAETNRRDRSFVYWRVEIGRTQLRVYSRVFSRRIMGSIISKIFRPQRPTSFDTRRGLRT